jgi:hypothetical protein
MENSIYKYYNKEIWRSLYIYIVISWNGGGSEASIYSIVKWFLMAVYIHIYIYI